MTKVERRSRTDAADTQYALRQLGLDVAKRITKSMMPPAGLAAFNAMHPLDKRFVVRQLIRRANNLPEAI